MMHRLASAVLAPVLALVAAMLITSGVVVFVGASPVEFWQVILTWPDNRNLLNVVNQASMIFLSATAAAIGFRMNLFNIGVEGQYRVASYVAAVFAGGAFLPGALNIVVSILLAMAAGAAWAAIPAILKVTRGVSEVISTIMLNAIAVFLVGYLLSNYGEKAGDGRRTTPLAEDSMLAGFAPFEERDGAIWTLALLAIVVGLAFWFVINRTRFGFDLRATGMNESAAVASGVSVKRMVVISMMLSGAVAGLIWLPTLFAETSSGNYFSSSVFQANLGFTGIAVALLGRNNPVGIGLGSLLFAFLSVQSNRLEFAGVDVSNDVVLVTQGVIVLTIVIAYEVVGRWRAAAEQRAVRAALDDTADKKEVGV
ncbi:ABC transporter permease [Nocardioides piscis]|uniref:ABC transporter permease n=1 Tax=Nocardioides piscis TaxID=2714938 RepID=A0A6G7YFS9_9ACTN|nr:ABC transporter permease [Nocardioides piscis]QIK75526.1 ABC transporter permease [Nocardioides piscis]